jgi:hypothetical protein
VEYESHVKHHKDLSENKKIVLTIRDLTPGKHKYNARVARVQVSRSEEALAKWDRLWVRSIVGVKDPEPWGVKIIEELGATVPGKPYSDIYEALEKL